MLKSNYIKKIFTILITLITSVIIGDTRDVENYSTINNKSIFVSFGNSVPTNTYDDYGSDGLSFKIAFENTFKNRTYLRYTVGWNYIKYAEYVVDFNPLNSTLDQIREGEKAHLFDLGLKLIANNGIANNGIFKPYISTSIGLGFFKQYTEYDGHNQIVNECDSFLTTLIHIIFDDDCDIETDYNINTVIDERMTSSFATVDIGTSFSSKNYKPSIDFGIRYNIVNKVRVNDWIVGDSGGTEDETLNDLIIRKLQADYKTYFIGVSWYLPLHDGKKNKRDRLGRGKLI